MSGYLLDEYPLLVMPSLAKKIGLNKAIVLQQCHYWLQRTSKVREGRKWFYKTYEEWMGELPFWSDKTIRRTITELEKDKLLITDNFNQKRSDKTKWYTIDYEIFNQIMNDKLVTSPCGQSDQSSRSDCPERLVKMTASIPDITTDTTSDIKNKTLCRKSKIYDEDSIHFQLANRLYQNILKNNPEHKKPNLQTWANDVRLMFERDNRTEEQISYLIDWVQQHHFWHKNILSISSLRKHFDRLILQIKADKDICSQQKQKQSKNIPKAYRSLQDWAEEEST